MKKTIGPSTKIGAVRRWCLDNPEETLSPSDMRTKFGIKGDVARVIVQRLRAEGLIHPESVYLATKPAPAANDDGKEAA